MRGIRKFVLFILQKCCTLYNIGTKPLYMLFCWFNLTIFIITTSFLFTCEQVVSNFCGVFFFFKVASVKSLVKWCCGYTHALDICYLSWLVTQVKSAGLLSKSKLLLLHRAVKIMLREIIQMFLSTKSFLVFGKTDKTVELSIQYLHVRTVPTTQLLIKLNQQEVFLWLEAHRWWIFEAETQQTLTSMKIFHIYLQSWLC